MQQYKCHACGCYFLGGNRLDVGDLWHRYVFCKQTISELSYHYGVSDSTIKRRLKEVRVKQDYPITSSSGIVMMDTTYFGRNFGVMLMIDVGTKEILWIKYVKHERLSDYLEGVRTIERQGYTILGIVCDGLKGIFKLFDQYNIQYCQFHQVAAVRRKLTMRPKLLAAQELWQLTKTLKNSEESIFAEQLTIWYNKWEWFLKEKSVDAITKKHQYKHKPLRSAYNSLRRNMPYLFTYLSHQEINMPNTNNAIEGSFTSLKNHLRVHNGMSTEQRMKFIIEFLRHNGANYLMR